MRRAKRCKNFILKSALLCTVLCTVVCLVLYTLDAFGPRDVTFLGGNFSKPHRTYRVLMWHSFGHDFFERIFGDNATKKCSFPCKFGQDRNDLYRSDVVVLQSFSKSFWESLPRRRRPGQAWVLYAMEPPYRLPVKASKLDTLGINWTLSYRFDADVVHRHGFRTVRRRIVKSVSAPDPKARPVAWIVSNCRSFSRRESYVRELQKVVPVDVFGRCGRHRCREQHFGCYREIAANYSFYLAFENSVCKDYSTEKLFHPLMNSMVPVVMGGANYSAVAPPGSYINFAHFRTARELGAYLLKLQGNPQEYKRYFEWKKHYYIERPSFGCTTCEQIHRLFRLPAREIRRSLYEYLWKEARCTTWQGLLNRTWS
ncbi:alpha-(1,3)-fucosyltransferase C-like [Dermacentor andersoni]|uniref:alpha-(1,3)-fucosyltransferase C-like n=1 Tax=Dermacentor andersoni TaxID=34620 RepID=UPI0021555F4A|nr:alpha-(1,3)-fucosyltransferase C-like [Dermacentor andersoni]